MAHWSKYFNYGKLTKEWNPFFKTFLSISIVPRNFIFFHHIFVTLINWFLACQFWCDLRVTDSILLIRFNYLLEFSCMMGGEFVSATINNKKTFLPRCWISKVHCTLTWILLLEFEHKQNSSILQQLSFWGHFANGYMSTNKCLNYLDNQNSPPTTAIEALDEDNFFIGTVFDIANELKNNNQQINTIAEKTNVS